MTLLTLEQNLTIAKEALKYVQSLNIQSYTHPDALSMYGREAFNALGDKILTMREESCNFTERRNYSNLLSREHSPWADKKAAKEAKCGNCGELASIAYTFILKHYGHILKQHNTNVEILYTCNFCEAERANHSFVVIGRIVKQRTDLDFILYRNVFREFDEELFLSKQINDPENWGDNAVICDPLFGIIFAASDFDGKLKMSVDDEDVEGSNYTEYCVNKENMIGRYVSFLSKPYAYPLDLYIFKLKEILNKYYSADLTSSIITPEIFHQMKDMNDFRSFCASTLQRILENMHVPHIPEIILDVNKMVKKIEHIQTKPDIEAVRIYDKKSLQSEENAKMIQMFARSKLAQTAKIKKSLFLTPAELFLNVLKKIPNCTVNYQEDKRLKSITFKLTKNDKSSFDIYSSVPVITVYVSKYLPASHFPRLLDSLLFYARDLISPELRSELEKAYGVFLTAYLEQP